MSKIIMTKRFLSEKFAYNGCELNIYNYGSGSDGNAIVLMIKNFAILLDAGIDPELFSAEHISKIKFALITHEHLDHAKYVKKLIDYYRMDIFLSKGTLEALDIKENMHVNTFNAPAVVFNSDNLYVEALRTCHDAKEPVMYIIEYLPYKILYVVDTSDIKMPGNYQFTHVLIEANYDKEILKQNYIDNKIDGYVVKRIIKNHLDIQKTINFLKTQNNLKQIYLLHLSEKNANPMLFKRLVKESTGIETHILKRRSEMGGVSNETPHD